MQILTKDTVLTITQYLVEDYKTNQKPYEGHYLHRAIKVKKRKKKISLKPGDVIVPTQQKHIKFICAVLIADAPDSYFAWNFFDSYLQQKEYFSAYVFEEKAIELLERDEHLKVKFKEKQQSDKEFANNRWAQLYYLYKNSPYYEQTHNVLPVYSIP